MLNFGTDLVFIYYELVYIKYNTVTRDYHQSWLCFFFLVTFSNSSHADERSRVTTAARVRAGGGLSSGSSRNIGL